MKSQLAVLVAAISLLASSPLLIAGELPFNAPVTPLAQENVELLHRVAQGLYEMSSNAALGTDGVGISDLWLFPTADADTVIAEYTLRTGQASSKEHLAVVTVQGNHVLRLSELPEAGDEPADGKRAPGDVRWSAVVGTGLASVPASVSATAFLCAGSQRSSANPHWTSKIGAGHAADSNSGSETAVVASRADSAGAR
jgi:hypothetical protein